MRGSGVTVRPEGVGGEGEGGGWRGRWFCEEEHGMVSLSLRINSNY